MNRYSHTQVGYLTITLLSAGIALVAYLMAASGFNWIALAVLAVLACCLVAFPTLSVTVFDDRVEVRFGPGIIRRRFLTRDIQSCRAVRNRWYWGWGIRMMPNGWLYNVSGLNAIELAMRNGGTYRIGTDAPEDLARAIQLTLQRKN